MADQLVLFSFLSTEGIHLEKQNEFLDFVEGDNVHGLDVVLKAGNLLLEIVHHDLVVLDDAGNLELLDAVTENSILIHFNFKYGE